MSLEPPDATARLVDHALTLTWDRIGPATRRSLKTFLLDTLCVGAAGAAAPKADAVLDVVKAWGAGGQASVLGRGDVRLPPTSAAFINAFQIHGQEFDCVHEAAVLHPMASLVAALRAETERSGPYDGARYLTAIAAGVDVAVALGLAPTTPLCFFRPATAGIFGSVAGLAHLKRLDRATTLDAFGYALAFASGTMQAHVEGKPALPVQVANAARGALVAIDLAMAGLAGPQRAIDGPFGYLNLFERGFELGRMLDDLEAVRRIDEVSCKTFPTGRAAQGGLEALRLAMSQQGLSAENLEALEFKAPSLIKRLVGRPALPGMDVAHARLCLPWLTAVALTRGEVRLGDFQPETLEDPELIVLADRVQVVEDGGSDPAAFTPLVLTARLTDGRQISVEVPAMPGSPQNPLTKQQHLDKAQRCLAHVGLQDRLRDLVVAIDRLETSPDVALALTF